MPLECVEEGPEERNRNGRSGEGERERTEIAREREPVRSARSAGGKVSRSLNI